MYCYYSQQILQQVINIIKHDYNYKPHIPHIVNKVSKKSDANTTINILIVNNRDKNLNILHLETTNHVLEILLF